MNDIEPNTVAIGDLKVAERRKKIAAASRLSRARKKEELQHLKIENKRLKTEQTELQTKVEVLEKTIQENLGKATYEDLQENEKLRREIEAQKKMMNFFLKVVFAQHQYVGDLYVHSLAKSALL
mmetsp:Transcript_9934/g.12972  ORF Transcript_9934/g.12972 Transcript_9934/m.12972 type:complete len:124 (+) Transcript_9934:241-612(+)